MTQNGIFKKNSKNKFVDDYGFIFLKCIILTQSSASVPYKLSSHKTVVDDYGFIFLKKP